MEEDVRRELDELRRRIADLENMLARLAGAAPVDPMPPERDPFRHPQPPPPGDYPQSSPERLDAAGSGDEQDWEPDRLRP